MMMRYLLLLFLPLAAMAQWGVEQPFFSAPAGPSGPDYASLMQYDHMRHWWSFEDLTNSPTMWTDRIGGYNLTPNNSPSMTTNGVTFVAASQQWLTGTNLVSPVHNGGTANSNALLVVLKADITSANHMAACNLYGGGNIYIGWDQADKLYAINAQRVPVSNTNTIDFLSAKFGHTLNADYSFLTNNIEAWTNNGSAFNPSVTLTHWGAGDGNAYWSGTIKEIIEWTNIVWTSTMRSNLHYALTNRMKFTP